MDGTYAVAGITTTDPVLYSITHQGSDDDSDYEGLLDPEADADSLLLGQQPSSAALHAHHQAGLVPGVDLHLARLQQDHNVSLLSLRHERELDDLAASAQQQMKVMQQKIAAQQQKIATQQQQLAAQQEQMAVQQQQMTTQLQHVQKRAKACAKALRAVTQERDAQAARAAAAEAEVPPLAEQLTALRSRDEKQSQQVTALKQQVTGLKTQVAAERQTFEVRVAAQQERLEDLSTRCLQGEQQVVALRTELETAHLGKQEAETLFAQTKEALDTARKEASAGSASASLEKERVGLLQREVEKQADDAERHKRALVQREAELREVTAALAAAREQRNQAARDADFSRVSAAEASDDLQRSTELAAASESRVAHAERKAAHEAMGRQRAEQLVEDAALQAQAARSQRQKRMLRILLRVTRVQLSLGFIRWVAAAAALDATAARERAGSTLKAADSREEARAALLRALELRNVQAVKAAGFGSAWLASFSEQYLRRAASAALARWSWRARAEARCIKSWEALVRAADREPRLRCLPPLPTGPQAVRTTGPASHTVRRLAPSWRALLYQRTQRFRAYHRRGFYRCKASYYDSGRVRRAIFVVWRLYAQGQLSAQMHVVEEARRRGLHVAGVHTPWWEVTHESYLTEGPTEEPAAVDP